MSFSLKNLLLLTTIAALACGLYVQQLRIDEIKDRFAFGDGNDGYSFDDDGTTFYVNLRMTRAEFKTAYPDEWKFLVMSKSIDPGSDDGE